MSKKIFSLILMALAMTVSAFAQETDVTTLTWVQKGQDCTQDFNNENGGTVFGTDAGGANISYVDVSAYGVIKLYGTPSQTARLFINREEAGDNGIFFVDLNGEGVATFDCNTVLTKQPKAQYIHLNGVKASAWNTHLNLSSITVSGDPIEFPEPDPFVLGDDEVEIGDLDWVNQGNGCANNLGASTDAPIYGTDAGPNGDQLSYVDVTNFKGMRVYGTAGDVVRAFINRAEYAGGTFQFYVTIGQDGVGTLDFDDVYDAQPGAEYIHINGLKASQAWSPIPDADGKAKVDHITLVKKPFEFPVGETDFTTLDFVNQGQGNVDNMKTSTDATIYGTDAGPNGDQLSYIDVSDYSTLKLYGTAGDVVRAFINRAEYAAGTFQFFITINNEGVGTLDLADVLAAQSGAEYIHINGFKASQTWAATPDADGKAQVDYISVSGNGLFPVNVSVGSTGFATFTPSVDLEAGTNISAYKASIEGDEITFTKVSTLKAGEGYLLCADGAKSEDFVRAAATANADNVFVGVTEEIASLATEADGYVNYILNNVGGNVGFYKAAGNKVAAGKAYLRVSASLPAAARSFFTFGGGEATAIEAVEAQSAASEVYNLQGQRVSQPGKGIYIVGGKKCVIR